jgi:diguanylate cyclase (GGDEF)-like protein
MALSRLKIKKLIKMGDLLGSSFTLEEAYGVIGREMPHLFPAGAFYRYDAGKKLLDIAIAWGGIAMEPVFSPDNCLAVRRNRPHLVAGATKGLPCPHFERSDYGGQASLCVPMRIYGEFIGLMHILFPLSPSGGEAPRTEQRRLSDNEQLAILAARQTGLDLRNLQFREEMSNLSTRDPLTGLINRRFAEEYLERELKKAEREKGPVGIIFMDIDHLGHFNQTFGLGTGERIIKDLGIFLGEHFQGKDTACRWGADEFLIILPGANLESAHRRAENIREILKEHAARDDHKQMRRVTLSMGVAVSPDHGDLAADLVQSAKAAVKRAKEEGRDRVKTAE